LPTDLAADYAAADAAAFAAESDLAADLPDLTADLAADLANLAADLAADLANLADLSTDLTDLTNLPANLAADLADLSTNLADLPAAGTAETGADITLNGRKLEESAGTAVDGGEKTAAGDDVRPPKVATLLSDLATDLTDLTANLANLPTYLSNLTAGLAADLADLTANLADLATDLPGLPGLAADLPNLAAGLPELAAERARATECAKLAPARHAVKEWICQLIDAIRSRNAGAGVIVGRRGDRRRHEAAVKLRLERRPGKRHGKLNLRANHLDFAQTKERQGQRREFYRRLHEQTLQLIQEKRNSLHFL
jgi:hypothetical protein